jgi:hypothetical protein
MTVSTTSRLAGPFTGTGADAVLPFSFKVFASADVVVQRDGVLIATGYSVALNADQDNSPGGTVTVLAASNTLGSTFFISSSTTATQALILPSQGSWLPKVIEAAFDKLTILAQEIGSVANRAIKVPIGQTAPDYATLAETFKGDPGGNVMAIGLFSGASALTIPAGVDRIQTTGYRAVGRGDATYFKWAVPMAALPAVGVGENAWWFADEDGNHWYPDPENLDLYHFGAYGDGTWVQPDGAFIPGHDDYPAWLAYKSFTLWLRSDDGFAQLYRTMPSLKISFGSYYTTGTWDMTDATYHIVCDGLGVGTQNGGNPVTLASAPGITAIEIEAWNTTGNTTRANGVGAQGTTIIGLRTWGTGIGSDPTANGFRCRGVFQLIRCSALNHPHDGLNVVATGGGGGADEGNANGFLVEAGDYSNNGRHGIFVDGADVNASRIQGPIFCNLNSQWGLYDSSFLGITNDVVHTRTNGLAGAGPAYNPNVWGCVCTYSGNLYFVQAGQATAASTTTPGTNSAVWGLLGVSGGSNPAYPAWITGQPWTEGGPYHCDSASSASTFAFDYSEGDQSPSVFSSNNLVIGGLHGAPIIGGVRVRAAQSLFQGAETGFQSFRTDAAGNTMSVILGGDADNNDLLYVSSSLVPQPWTWHFNTVTGNLEWNYQTGAFTPFIITGPNTTSDGGRSSTIPHSFMQPLGVFLGPAERSLTSDSAAPTTGAHAAGEFVFNSAGAVGNTLGWYCTTNGTPGTFVPAGIVGAVQAAHVANGANSAGAPTQAEFDALVTQFNALLASLQTAKLMA